MHHVFKTKQPVAAVVRHCTSYASGQTNSGDEARASPTRRPPFPTRACPPPSAFALERKPHVLLEIPTAPPFHPVLPPLYEQGAKTLSSMSNREAKSKTKQHRASPKIVLPSVSAAGRVRPGRGVGRGKTTPPPRPPVRTINVGTRESPKRKGARNTPYPSCTDDPPGRLARPFRAQERGTGR